jgi:hypothetical protein
MRQEQLNHRIKPGKTLVSYRDVECPELGIENTKNKDSKKILEYFHSKMEEESFDGKGEAILNLGKVVDMISSPMHFGRLLIVTKLISCQFRLNMFLVHRMYTFCLTGTVFTSQTFCSVIDAFAGNDVKHGLPKHEFDTDKSKRDETPLVQNDGELETCKDGASETECIHSMYQKLIYVYFFHCLYFETVCYVNNFAKIKYCLAFSIK